MRTAPCKHRGDWKFDSAAVWEFARWKASTVTSSTTSSDGDVIVDFVAEVFRVGYGRYCVRLRCVVLTCCHSRSKTSQMNAHTNFIDIQILYDLLLSGVIWLKLWGRTQGRILKVCLGERWVGSATPSPRKCVFHLKWRILVISKRYFLSVPSPEKCWFFAWSGDLVDAKDVLLGSSKYSVRVVGLVSCLLHCNTSNLAFETVKHDKNYGFALASHSQTFWRI